MVIRPTTKADLILIRAALHHLREARNLFREVGAKKAAAYVRRALKSGEGAERHAERARFRSEPHVNGMVECPACPPEDR